MKRYPAIPDVAEAPDELLDGGHLWIQESLDGEQLRFQLQDTGVIAFGDRVRVFDSDSIPGRFDHAVRHVRERLDREALRAAVDDVTSVVFFGEAMHRIDTDYDWARTPSFLGFDVWSSARGTFLAPDAVQQIYERLGLHAVNTVEQEVRAVDFDPDSYAFPRSEWYDGPAAGVVLRNKTGLRAKLVNPDWVPAEEPDPVDEPASTLAGRYVTRSRVTSIARDLSEQGHPVTVDAVYDRALEGVIRERHRQLFHGASDVDVGAFHAAVAALVREFIDEWDE